MDEQLKVKLVGYLDAVEKAVQTGADFVAVEVPDVARQWLIWLGVEAALYAVAALIVAIVLYRMTHAVDKEYNVASEKDKGFYAGYGLFLLAVSVVMLMYSAGYAMRCAKIIIAPKVVIVEKVAELIKPVRGK